MSEWHGCYDGGWQGEIVPEAFSHPAKFSRALVQRIYAHMLEQGWIAAGGRILDCFGGVGLGGLDALVNGLHWVGVELEPRFVELGNQNIDLWQRHYGAVATGSARLLQGDSRRLCEVIAAADGLVTSPPYEESLQNDGADRIDRSKCKRDGDCSHQKNTVFKNGLSYGATPGQLGAMKPGDFDGAVSSPPYEDSTTCRDPNYEKGRTAGGGPLYGDYGSHPNNIGNQSGDTFWQASREIVQQCHAVLKPGAYTAWVVKGYVKGGELVDFPARWRQLCEACGFVLVEEVHASLVKEQVQGVDLFSGEAVVKRTERKSFFRRMAEKNGAPPIDFETVLFMRKVGEGGGVDALVASPPYEETPINQTHMTSNKRGDPDNPNYRPSWKTKLENGYADTTRDYGATPGQLGSMKPGDFDEVLNA